ncbi:hypothetical protein [Luteibacter sp. E-22]|uniref:hypothetical protein n=1 Tax=Luteibacter sp. E-22 TaxID=3404050 RepID=UPI003CEA680F
MNTPSRPTTSLADVRQLTYFQIYKTNPSEQHGTIKLFSNGNQQCPIKVGLVAADADENPITLTENEIKQALTLIFYDDGSALGDGYTSSFDKNRFTWTESAIPVKHPHEDEPGLNSKAEASRAAADEPPASIQIITLYVSVTPGSSGRALAARFQVNENLYFTTSPSVHDSEGQGRDGEFDSSVDVLLAEPPFLSAMDFGAASNGVVTGRKVGDSTTYFYWAVEYYLNPKLNGIALPLDSVGSSASVGGKPPAGAFGFYVHGDFFAHVQWGISYYGQPGGTDAESGGLPVPPLYALVAEPTPLDATQNSETSTATITVHAGNCVDRVTTTVHYIGGGSSHGEHDTSPDSDIPYAMYKNCVGQIVGANKSRVVIGILKGNLPRKFTDIPGGTIPDKGSTAMHILDAYGNDHMLSLSYDANADEFTIS